MSITCCDDYVPSELAIWDIRGEIYTCISANAAHQGICIWISRAQWQPGTSHANSVSETNISTHCIPCFYFPIAALKRPDSILYHKCMDVKRWMTGYIGATVPILVTTVRFKPSQFYTSYAFYPSWSRNMKIKSEFFKILCCYYGKYFLWLKRLIIFKISMNTCWNGTVKHLASRRNFIWNITNMS